jgi:glutamate-1-semialdehyde 2,1-aminomutase
MLVRAGSGLAEMASPDSAGVSKETAGETIVVPLDDLKAFERAFELHGKEIAAVILEPVPANNGLLTQTDEFLKEAARIARAHGALVIFDEVITGFRVAFGGMAEKTGIKPDLVTYGKVIGGGFPVGAYGGRGDLMDLVAPSGPVYQAGTLSANPVAMSAGLAQVKKLKRENPYPALAKKTEELSRELEKISAKHGGDVSVQNYASLFWPVLWPKGEKPNGAVRAITRIPPSQKERYAKAFHLFLGEGIYLAPSGYEVCFLSTAHSGSDLEKFKATFERALRA